MLTLDDLKKILKILEHDMEYAWSNEQAEKKITLDKVDEEIKKISHRYSGVRPRYLPPPIYFEIAI